MSPLKWQAIALSLIISACASQQPLRVASHVVRDEQHNGDGGDPMARNEKLRRLHGAVSMEERRNLLGQYYTLKWHIPAESNRGPASITFEYQQGATASQIKTIRRSFPTSTTSDTTEIAITGDDYLNGGRILAWRATLRSGNEIISTRKSYLWE